MQISSPLAAIPIGTHGVLDIQIVRAAATLGVPIQVMGDVRIRSTAAHQQIGVGAGEFAWC